MKNFTYENSVSHFGIRMVYKLAYEVTYYNSLNLNNLIIKMDEK